MSIPRPEELKRLLQQDLLRRAGGLSPEVVDEPALESVRFDLFDLGARGISEGLVDAARERRVRLVRLLRDVQHVRHVHCDGQLALTHAQQPAQLYLRPTDMKRRIGKAIRE